MRDFRVKDVSVLCAVVGFLQRRRVFYRALWVLKVSSVELGVCVCVSVSLCVCVFASIPMPTPTSTSKSKSRSMSVIICV